MTDDVKIIENDMTIVINSDAIGKYHAKIVTRKLPIEELIRLLEHALDFLCKVAEGGKHEG